VTDDLTTRLRATFVQELEEQVRELNAALLALEQSPGDVEVIRTLFRSAHTVKGAARVANVPEVEHVCHAMESVFAMVREGTQTLTGSDFSLLLAACDALEEAGARLRRNESLDGSSVRALLPRIEAMAGNAPAVHAPPRPQHLAPAPSAPPAAPRVVEPAVQAAAEPAAEPEPAEPAAGSADRSGDMVRVRADRLDALLAAVGELMIATGRVVASSRGSDDARRLDAATDTVGDVVRQLRLRPFSEICDGLPRAARDVAAADGKEVELTITGQDVEADRKVIDALRDPLLHLVRNAVDHGIEAPAERERAGKPRAGHVQISATLVAGRLVITVSDDGSGLDEAAIRASARERGGRAAANSEELAHTLLAGGLSTRAAATTISGRGVGLDIVRTAMERIGGGVDVSWTAGAGTTFTLECPPAPSTLRAVLVRLGPHVFAFPTAHIERLRRVSVSELKSAGGRTVLASAQGPVQVHSLAALLGAPLEVRPIEERATVVIASAGARRAAFIVDDVLDEDELVIRPIRADDGAVPHAAGAAVMPSGQVALVLATPSLLSAAQGLSSAPVQRAAAGRPRRRVLVADDSITTRTLEQSVFEAAGYTVVTAVNGEDAWRQLEQEGADAVVADVEMPRMDGFALCRRIRASGRFRTLPIVLVTGLASPEDRARGLEAGADAYIVKSGFDQATLLDTVNQLIGDE
jgi:two-component system chemotaxis sensor kinase CheA